MSRWWFQFFFLNLVAVLELLLPSGHFTLKKQLRRKDVENWFRTKVLFSPTTWRWLIKRSHSDHISPGVVTLVSTEKFGCCFLVFSFLRLFFQLFCLLIEQEIERKWGRERGGHAAKGQGAESNPWPLQQGLSLYTWGARSATELYQCHNLIWLYTVTNFPINLQ